MDISSCSSKIVITRNFIIRLISLVYLFNYLSLYIQIDGLFGDEGIYPVNLYYSKINSSNQVNSIFVLYPNLLYFSGIFKSILDLFTNSFIEFSGEEIFLFILCLIGITISLLNSLNFKYFYNSYGYFALWVIYLTFFLNGTVFISENFDLLLLESGFLSIFLAPTDFSRIQVVSLIEEHSFYLLKFLLFRVIFSNGITKILSGCQLWANLEAFNHIPLSSTSPNKFSFYFYHLVRNDYKKIITAICFGIELFIPFIFMNLLVRKLRIFAGIIVLFLNIFYLLFSGLPQLYFVLVMSINISNFDDDFFMDFFPEFVIKFFGLDLGLIKKKITHEEFIRIQRQKKILQQGSQAYKIKHKNDLKKDLNNENKIKSESEEDANEVNADSKNDSKAINPENLGKNFDNNLDLNNITIEPPNDFLFNLYLFLVFILTSLLLLFQFVFPIIDILNGTFKIYPKLFLKYLLDKYFLNLFMIYIFFMIFLKSIQRIYTEYYLDILSIYNPNDKGNNIKLKNGKNIIFLIFMIFYYILSIDKLYTTLELNIEDPVMKFAVKISYKTLNRYHISHSYGLFEKIENQGSKIVLDFVYRDEENKLQSLNRKEDHTLSFFKMHIPRLNNLLNKNSNVDNIDYVPYLAILTGRILEKNPVALDLIGVHSRVIFGIFHDSNQDMSWRKIKLLKITKFKYNYNYITEVFSKGKLYQKREIKDFLPYVELNQLQGVFNSYGLKLRTDQNHRNQNIFTYIDIYEVVIILSSILIFIKMNYY